MNGFSAFHHDCSLFIVHHVARVIQVGSDAAVALYVGDRDGTGKIAQRLDSAVAPQDAGALDRTMESMNYSILGDCK